MALRTSGVSGRWDPDPDENDGGGGGGSKTQIVAPVSLNLVSSKMERFCPSFGSIAPGTWPLYWLLVPGPVLGKVGANK